MGGEDALAADGFDVGLGGVAQWRAVHARFEQPEGEQRGVALIHVVDLGLAAEGVEQRRCRRDEDGLLAKAVVGVAAVEMVGEVAVPGIVAVDVGVEQKDGDDVAGDAGDVKAPGAEQHSPALHIDGDDLIGRGKDRLRRPGHVGLGLLALKIEVLLEVAAAMDERDGNHGAAVSAAERSVSPASMPRPPE